MEVRETAACGVAEREFCIDLGEDEIVNFFQFLVEAEDAADKIDPELINGMLAQIRQIVGPAVEQQV